ncbi:MAG: HEAT repeat domain-containing protein [Candidatus Riflebacteria bacterium]|nr:HEAT repeat domain-containing protein [Candidatus Riflebacteria bacterium]
MQCPGCGFENEIGNKFCNMCGMALPVQGDASQTPLERAPLDLDLSLETPDLGGIQNPQLSGGEPSLELNADQGLNLDDMKLDTSGLSELSLDLSTTDAPDFGADLKIDSTPDMAKHDDVKFDLDNSPTGLELNFEEPAKEPGLDFSSPPMNAPEPQNQFENFDVPVNEKTLHNQESIQTFEMDISQEFDKELGQTSNTNLNQEADLFSIEAPLSSENKNVDFSTGSADSSTPFGNDFEQQFASEVVEMEKPGQTIEANFNFGDLDVNATSSEPLVETPSFIEPPKTTNKIPSKPSTNAPAQPIPTTAKTQPSLKTPSPKPVFAEPQFDPEISFVEEENILPPSEVVKPIEKSKTAAKAKPSLPQPKIPEPPQIDVEENIPELQPEAMDEDLADLYYGIEGKAPPKHVPIAPAKGETFESLMKSSQDEIGGFSEEQKTEEDSSSVQHESGLSGIPEIATMEEASVESAQPESPSIMAEMVNLTPEERLSEIALRLESATDPDERYSLVLALKEIKLPEANQHFIKLLGDELKDIREIAAEYLGELGCHEAVSALLQCLTSGDPSLVFIAARSLGNIKEESTVGPLVKLLEEDNDDLRYVALESLGKIGAPSALKAIAAFLKSRNHDLRFVASEAIGNIKDPQAVTLLLPMLKDSDFEVRLKAIEALGKIGSTGACDQLLVILGEDNERIRLSTIQALGQIRNPNAVEALVDIFHLGNPQIKEKIVWALGEIGSERAVEPLLSLSQNFNNRLIFLAIEAFSKIKSPKAARFVLSMLDRKDLSLRLKAIEALGEIADKSSAGNLVNFLESGEPELKISAAKALGKIGNPVAIDPLVSKLMDSERDVRLAGIEALGNIRGIKAIPALINSLREQDEQIITKAEWALCEMNDLAVEPTTKALFTEPKEVLPSLVKVLGKIGSVRAIFPLLKVLESAEGKLKLYLADALLSVDKHLTEENPISVVLKEGYAWAQFSIAQALSVMGDERAFPLLIKIARDSLTDKDIKKLAGIPDKRILECSTQILELIRLNVSRLFARVGNDRAIPVLMQYFTEGDLPQRQWCVEALGGIQTEGALDALIDILKKPEFQLPLDLLSKQLIGSKSRKLVDKLIISSSHPNETVRMAIAVVLGETNDPRAIKTLSGLVKDPSGRVRSAAIEAIGKIGTTAAVQPAIEALKDSMESVRSKAAQVLGELGDTAAVEFLERATKDGSELVRCISVKALSTMQDPRVSEILTNSLGDNSEEVRAASVEVLGGRKDRLAIAQLTKSLEDASERVREKAAIALGQIGDTRAILPLLLRLDDPSPLVPLACSEAVVSFKTKSFPVLIEALKADEERIRRHSCDLLVRIGDEELVGKLLRLLNDRNNFLRENVARILGKIGDGKVVDPLIGMLNDRSSSVRRTAAEALGYLRDIRSIVALKKAERDQSKEVRQAAAQSLQEIFKAHKLN